MKTSKRIAKNTFFLYGRTGITMFISLYTTRLILNALGAADFGLFNLIGGAIAMLAFLNASMAAATQRFMNYAEGGLNKERVKAIFNISVVLHILIALVVLVILEIAGYFFFHGVLNIQPNKIVEAKLIYQFMVISTLFTIISVPYDAVINAHENMFLFAVLGVIESMLRLGVAFFVMEITIEKLNIYGLLTSIVSIIMLLVRRIYCQKKYEECKINIKKYYSKSLMKEMTSFAGWSLLGTSTGMLSNYGQGIILNIFFGTAINAAQGIANQISGQLSVFATIMLKALNPSIDKNEGAGNRKMMVKITMTGSKLGYFLFAIFSIPVIIDMPYILKLWLQNVPQFAIIFCRLLLIKNLIEQLFSTLSLSIAAVGNIKNFQISISILALFPLLLSYILFHYGYPPYVLYVVFIIQASIRCLFITLHYAGKHEGFSKIYFIKNVVLRSLLVTLIAYIVNILLLKVLSNSIPNLILFFLITTVVFSVLIYYIGLLKEEKNHLRLISETTLIKFKPYRYYKANKQIYDGKSRII